MGIGPSLYQVEVSKYDHISYILQSLPRNQQTLLSERQGSQVGGHNQEEEDIPCEGRSLVVHIHPEEHN